MVLQWLFIDTSVSGRVRFGLLGGTGALNELEGRAGVLLPALSKMKLQKIAGICVVEGPGSFSAVRGGIIVANLLSRVMKIPLVGVSAEEAKDADALRKRLEEKGFPIRSFVAPVYDAEPNITVKKTSA